LSREKLPETVKSLIKSENLKKIENIHPQRVLFTSEFGTGKTTVLKAKATQF